MSWLSSYGRGVRIQVKVQPRASCNEVVGITEEYLRIRLTAPPVDGKANKQLVKFLGQLFRCGAGKVRILHGTSGRCKLVEIDGISEDDARRLVKNCFRTEV